MDIVEIKEETKIPQADGSTVVLEAGDKIKVLKEGPGARSLKDAVREYVNQASREGNNPPEYYGGQLFANELANSAAFTTSDPTVFIEAVIEELQESL